MTKVLSFVVLGVSGGILNGNSGAWNYTSLLTGAAERAVGPAFPRSYMVAFVCTLVLLAGGISAAISLRRFTLTRPKVRSCAAKLVGGATMGVAAMMISGGNDMLLLSGLPSLSGNAWAAYAAMMAALLALAFL